jgi:hypothetical protein
MGARKGNLRAPTSRQLYQQVSEIPVPTRKRKPDYDPASQSLAYQELVHAPPSHTGPTSRSGRPLKPRNRGALLEDWSDVRGNHLAMLASKIAETVVRIPMQRLCEQHSERWPQAM